MKHFEWRALHADDTATLAQRFRAAVGQLAAADYDAAARVAASSPRASRCSPRRP
ncbi:hypothetical protein PQQ52_12675 [Paraburkholderia sediminicola]|uniref:hypothetical protein n=1 Tax=Paraburkholderia sediminicola TaxID=458836 RepID=UPI0038BA39A2